MHDSSRTSKSILIFAERVGDGLAKGDVGDGVTYGGVKARRLGVRKGRASGPKRGWASPSTKSRQLTLISSVIHSQSSLSSSTVLQAQLERPLRKFHDSRTSSSDIRDDNVEESHEPGGYIAPDSRTSRHCDFKRCQTRPDGFYSRI